MISILGLRLTKHLGKTHEERQSKTRVVSLCELSGSHGGITQVSDFSWRNDCFPFLSGLFFAGAGEEGAGGGGGEGGRGRVVQRERNLV